MFVVIIGAGKVGLNTARSLMHIGHEIILVEQRRMRYNLLIDELQETLLFGDGTELFIMEKAGIARADMVVAVTGDDEDNLIISQVAKLKYGVTNVVARVNNPANQRTFDLLGVDANICAATSLIRLIQHELPVHKFVHLLSLKRENIDVVELEVGERSPFANKLIRDIEAPEGVLITAVLRGGKAILARLSVEILPGDYVICFIDPSAATDLIKAFMPDEEPERVRDEGELDMSQE